VITITVRPEISISNRSLFLVEQLEQGLFDPGVMWMAIVVSLSYRVRFLQHYYNTVSGQNQYLNLQDFAAISG
jgi:hypothetical protein